MHCLKYHKKPQLHSRCDYWYEAWLLDIQARHPSAQHPTKSSFTTPKKSLYLGPKCHAVLMLQNFQWIFRLRFFRHWINIPCWRWPCYKSCNVKQPSHPVSALSKKKPTLFTLSEVGDNTGWKMLSNTHKKKTLDTSLSHAMHIDTN